MTAYSPALYTSDGVNATYVVPWPYLSQSDVQVTVGGVAYTGAVTWPSAGSITLTPNPVAGSAIVVLRSTQVNVPDVVWSGGPIASADLNHAVLQLLYREQELLFVTPTAPTVAVVSIPSIAALRLYQGADVGPIYLVSYYGTPDDGGEGYFSHDPTDSTSADNGGSIIVDPLGRRWKRPGASVQVTMRQFGCKADGTTPCTAQLQAAVSCGALKVIVDGSFMLGAGTVSVEGIELTGLTQAVSYLTTNQATGPVLKQTMAYSYIHDLTMTSSVFRTADPFIWMNYSACAIRNVTLANFFVGIYVYDPVTGPSGPRINNIGLVHNAGNYSQIGIVVAGNGADQIIDGVYAQAALEAAVQIRGCGDVKIKNVCTVAVGIGVLLEPDAGFALQDGIGLCYINECLFDSGTQTGGGSSGWGVYMYANGGVIDQVHMTDSWVASNASHGVLLQTADSGLIRTVDFRNNKYVNNSGDGVHIADSGTQKFTSNGDVFATNQTDLFVGASVTDFKVQDGRFGPWGIFTASRTANIALGGSNDNFDISGCTFAGAPATITGVGATAGTQGLSWKIHDNIGFVTYNRGHLTTDGTNNVFTITHGLAITPASAADINVIQDAGTATPTFDILNITSTTFQISFNTAPAISYGFAWAARVGG